MIRYVHSLLFGLSVLLPLSTLAAVRYDSAHDHLNVTAQNQPLSQVLGEVADATGMKILMDPTVDRPVTAEFSEVSLRLGLKRLTNGMNVVLIEEPVKNGTGTAPAVLKLLPSGQSQSERLQPLGKKTAVATKPATDKNYRRERRVDKLPAQQRDAAVARMNQQTQAKQARKSERVENKTARHAKQEARHAEREAARTARLARLAVTDPEVYARRMVQEAQRTARQQAKSEHQSTQQ